MKRILIPTAAGLAAMLLLSGCVVGFNFGGGKKESANNATTTSSTTTTTTSNNQHPAMGQQVMEPTIGQQLIDLKRAKDSGAITEAEYEAEKAKLLGGK